MVDYTEFIRVYDWAHVNRNIRDKLKHILNKPKRELIMADITQLQVCKSKEVFKAAVVLFLSKWRSLLDDGIDLFSSKNKYFLFCFEIV